MYANEQRMNCIEHKAGLFDRGGPGARGVNYEAYH